MELLAGTSGFSYKPWKGPFYPEKLAATKMLAYYAERLPIVEINSTFRRLPKREQLEKWAAQVPDGFRFVIKASQRITHFTRLGEGAAEPMKHLMDSVAALGPKLGPVLFQLPPNMKADVPRLEAFLALLPAGRDHVFEFRHTSWLTDGVLAALEKAGAALCTADGDDDALLRLAPTTDWGYLRLRRDGYTADDLNRWRDRIQEQPWKRAYVMFKHEDEGAAPRLALQLNALWNPSGA